MRLNEFYYVVLISYVLCYVVLISYVLGYVYDLFLFSRILLLQFIEVLVRRILFFFFILLPLVQRPLVLTVLD